MKKFFVFFILLNSFIFVFSQTLFPDRCLGVWDGTMLLNHNNQSVDSVKVEFTVAKTDSQNVWIWKTQYLSPTYPMIKDYRIKLKDNKQNIFVIDELDGILLECKVFGNIMLSMFSVEKQMLACRYELVGDSLIFEIYSGKSMGEITQGVEDFSIFSLQRVVLKKR